MPDDKSTRVMYAIWDEMSNVWMGPSGRFQPWVSGLESAKLFVHLSKAEANVDRDDSEVLVSVRVTREVIK